MLANDGGKGVSIEHGEDLFLVGHLHGWRVIILVASYDILSGTLRGDSKLLAQFS